MKKYTNLRVAVVHDSMRYYGGAERVVEALMEIWPDAQLYVSTTHWSGLGKYRKSIEGYNPKTSWVQSVPFFSKHPYLYRYFLPFVWRSFDFSEYDVVISSSGAQMSHLIQVPNEVLHFCYCHTPPRHLYGYKTDFDWSRFVVVRMIVKFLNHFLRSIDYRAAQRVDFFIANSKEVQERIERCYDRKAIVIYPPLTKLPKPRKVRKRGGYYLVVSRLSRMKNINLIIKTCNEMKRNLYVVGKGPEKERLRKMAGTTIKFFGQVSDLELSKLYSECKAVICAGEDEDFGIVPVEAMSFGRPVIAYKSGAYKETVVGGETGLFFTKLSRLSLKRAMRRFEKKNFSAADCVKQARKFSRKRFEREMNKTIRESMYQKNIL